MRSKACRTQPGTWSGRLRLLKPDVIRLADYLPKLPMMVVLHLTTQCATGETKRGPD